MKAHLIGIKRTYALVVCDKRMPRSVCASTESVEVVVLTLCVVETHRSNSQEFVWYGAFLAKLWEGIWKGHARIQKVLSKGVQI